MGGVFAHWPNRITALRFLGACVLFLILGLWGERSPEEMGGLAQVAFWLFVVMAGTDFLDGYLARRYDLVSAFGRIADPFVDKVLVLGSMIFLAVMDWSRVWIPAWVVVVVLAREFLVTGIRGYIETIGREFPADRFGKIKMVVQCVAISAVFALPAFPWPEPLYDALDVLAHVSVWATLVTTVGSGLSYAYKTQRILAQSDP